MINLPAAQFYTDEAVIALRFIATKKIILTIAASWSEQGHILAADLIARSAEALRKYHVLSNVRLRHK